jgi:RimJ/RimL family protein N-acetyltransferase
VVWYSVMVPDLSDERDGVTTAILLPTGVGTVCIWRRDEHREPIGEIGWMVLPRFQRRGLASAAVRSILERASTRTGAGA